MKLHSIILTTALAINSMVMMTANAATKPKQIVAFTPKAPTHTLQTKSTSWRDPAFGNEGWTHNSGWGKFSTSEGKIVNIKLTSATVGLHPGITVWYRGACDTAPDNYVADHFYTPTSNIYEPGAKSEDGKTSLGTICMQVAAYGYDQDGHSLKPTALHGLSDKVSGQMELTFIAPQTGSYVFVVGGINPAKTVSSKDLHNVNATVSVTQAK